MAPSSKSEKDDDKQKPQKKRKDHIVKLLTRGRVGPTHLKIAWKGGLANERGSVGKALLFLVASVLWWLMLPNTKMILSRYSPCWCFFCPWLFEISSSLSETLIDNP